MTFARTSVAALALAALAAAWGPAQAESLASSASSAASDSVGSVSNSFKGSSNASSGNKVALNGRYEIDQMQAVAGAPERVQLALKSLDHEGELLTLELPRQTLVRAMLGTGDVITATPRPYGTQFAAADTQQAFFLVVEDAWMNELPSRPVSL